MKQSAAHGSAARARSRGPLPRMAASPTPMELPDAAAAGRAAARSMASLESLCDRRDAAQAQPFAPDGPERAKGGRG